MIINIETDIAQRRTVFKKFFSLTLFQYYFSELSLRTGTSLKFNKA